MRGIKTQEPEEGILEKLFLKEKKSASVIAQEIGASKSVVYRWLQKRGWVDTPYRPQITKRKSPEEIRANKIKRAKSVYEGRVFGNRMILNYVEKEESYFCWQWLCQCCGASGVSPTAVIRKPHKCNNIPVKENTIEEVGEFCKLWDEGKNHFALVDKEDIPKLKEFYWRVNCCGYWEATNKSNKKDYPAHLMLHRYVMEATDPKELVDHINRNKHDNRKFNLRLCTGRQNSYNRSQIKSKRKYKGVEWQSYSKTYRVRIGYREKLIPIGVYANEEVAGLMYNHYATCLYGEFASLNPIEGRCVKNIFLVSGKAQHGKNTFSTELKKELEERDFKIFECAFADILKTFCIKYYNFSGTKDEEGRKILQETGDMFRRNNPNIFVNVILELIRGIYSEYDFVIITDLRFKNELREVQKAFPNSVSIRVVRHEFDNGLTAMQKTHPSEIQLDEEKFDFYVNNDADIVCLRQQAKSILNKTFSPYLAERMDIWDSSIYNHLG